MNTLLLAPELFTGDGGIARILRLYLKAMCELAGDAESVSFVSLNDANADTRDLGRYSTERLRAWHTCDRKKARFTSEAFRQGLRSDRLVCGHVSQSPVAWAVSMLRPQLRYFIVAHGIEVWRPFTLLERLAIRRARRILCVSEFTRSELLRHCPVPGSRTAVLSNSLDPHLQPANPGRPPDGSPIILSISRLSLADNYKGISHVISAMPAVLANAPGVRLRIVGRGDGLPALQSLARTLGLGEAVEFSGYRTDFELREDLAQCRLFALPSQKEGFGLVYLEAMANGRPSLGARSGGVPEVITPETGVLVDYGDVPAIASAISAALKREWDPRPMLERADHFSFVRFKERLRVLLSE